MSGRFACNTERRRFLPAFVAASFALALLLSALLPAVFRAWNDQVLDGLFRLRYLLRGRAEISPYLVHVVVNDASYRDLGLPAWDRDVFGQALGLLQDSEARVIACDVLIRDAGFPQNDRLLIQSVGKAKRVILPLLVYPGQKPGSGMPDSLQFTLHLLVRRPGKPPVGGEVAAPFFALAETARGFGHINAEPELDGRIRRIPLLYRYEDGYIPALSLMAVLAYFDLDPEDLEVYFGRHLVLRSAQVRDGVRKDLSIPIDEQGRILVNFAGPSGDSFSSFPVHRLLTASREAEASSRLLDLLEGTLAVVSDTSTVNRDYGPGVFESLYPLSGVHLNVINSILTENFLSELGLRETLVSSVLIAVLLGLAAARLRTGGFYLFCLLLFVILSLLAAGLFVFANKVPDAVTPTLGLVLTVFAVGVFKLSLSEREKAAYETQLEVNAKLEAANWELANRAQGLQLANEELSRKLQSEEGSSVGVAEAPTPDMHGTLCAPGSSRAQRAQTAGGRNSPIPELEHPEAFAEIVTRDAAVLAKLKYAESIAANSNPVLITGESGVGKELVARAIHRLSGRTGKFVSENIAGLDDTMVTDTLFGHAKGAFTDAELTRKGLVEEARGGTLFLDEIGDMSVNSQVKLLRLIEEKEYRPLGLDEVRISDARIIIATNVNLEKKLEEGKFREDLYYRLTHHLNIPPLRERTDDLPLLVEHFARMSAEALGVRTPAIPKELILLLACYSFPGNIRELKNMMDNALGRNKARSLPLGFFKEYIRSNSNKRAELGVQLPFTDRFPTLKELDSFLMAEALRRTGGNQSSAAKLLGLSASALSRRLNRQEDKENP
jgi:DNA-binding NtrC family response regulator/CHASE2 domain-containing sensor protein